MKVRSRAIIVVAVFALVGGTTLAISAIRTTVVPPDLNSELAAFRDVCIAPPSHGAILTKARASGWGVLKGEVVPALLRGNGASRLQEVRQGAIAGRPVLISVADLGGTSECRVYFRTTDPVAMVERLKGEVVLGAPLGAPDFDGELNYPEGWKAIGWHRSVASDWRAVHYSFDSDQKGPNAGWQSIEVTRKI